VPHLYVALFKHLLKHEDLLNLSDAVINAWRQQLGHDAEDDEAGFDDVAVLDKPAGEKRVEAAPTEPSSLWSRERSRSRARLPRGRGFWSFNRATRSRCEQRARRV
jgi:hypothetical protein